MSEEKRKRSADDMPKYGRIRDLTYTVLPEGTYEYTDYREMHIPSYEMKIIVAKVLAQIRRDKEYSQIKLAKNLHISQNCLTVREHLGLNTMDRFISHCEALRVDPEKVFSDCLYIYKKNQKLRKEIHHAKEKAPY